MNKLKAKSFQGTSMTGSEKGVMVYLADAQEAVEEAREEAGKQSNPFMKRVKIIKEWFEMEEMEVNDTVVGRMAFRLGKFEDQAREEVIEEVLDYFDDKVLNKHAGFEGRKAPLVISKELAKKHLLNKQKEE